MHEWHALPAPGHNPDRPLHGTWRVGTAVADVTPVGPAYYVAGLASTRPGSGDGLALMTAVMQAADRHTVGLMVAAAHPSLTGWYERMGFGRSTMKTATQGADLDVLFRLPKVAAAPHQSARFMHADPTCPVCFPQGLGAGLAAVPAPPLPNPESGGLHWYHGTHFDPSEDHEAIQHGEAYHVPEHLHSDPDPHGHLKAPDTYEAEYGQHSNQHWNTGLGVHFTGIKSVAESFANGSGGKWGTTPTLHSRIAHTFLHMANPKHYASEEDMGRHAIQIAHDKGMRYLSPDDHEGHEAFVRGEEHPSGDYEDSERTEAARQNLSPEGRRAVSDIDRSGAQPRHSLHEVDGYLANHPDRENILHHFREHLESQGHDGITYGNEYEGPKGHICAIALDPHQIHVRHWEHLHPDHANHQPPQTQYDPHADQGTIDGKMAAYSDMLRAEHRERQDARKGYNPGDDTSDMGYGKDVGWVHIDHVKPYREYDRAGSTPEAELSGESTAHTRKTVDEIAGELRSGRGFTDPLMLKYHHPTNQASLGEGNHRLDAAIKAGFTHVPVRIVRAYQGEADSGEMKPFQHPAQTSDKWLDHMGRYRQPETQHPSEVFPPEAMHRTAGRFKPVPLKQPVHPFTPHPDDPSQCTECNLPASNRHHVDEADFQRAIHVQKHDGDYYRIPVGLHTQAHVLDTWEPKDRLFAPTQKTLDPRLFDADRHMLPAVRSVLMQKMDGFMSRHGGKDWTSWARMYLAGSEASLWWGNNDFDILVGVNYDAYRKATGSNLRDEEITDAFNRAFRVDWNDEEWHPPFREAETWHLTGYVNPASYDIRAIKPYAAYEVVSDTWFVEPISEPTGHQFDESQWYYMEGFAERIRAAMELREPSRTNVLRRIWHFLHADRSRAFGPNGTGAFDRGNATEKYLDQAGLWDALVQANFGHTAAKDDRFAGVTLKQDDDGYYVTTHRARSDSYESPEKIPQKDVDFIESTGSKEGPCTCCNGTGEHPSGHECWRCDASGQEKGAWGTCDAETMSRGASAGTYTYSHHVDNYKYGDQTHGDETPLPTHEEVADKSRLSSGEAHFQHRYSRNGSPVARLRYGVDPQRPGVLKVDSLATHPAHRGAGLASALMDQMQNHAEQHGYVIDHGERTAHGAHWWASYSQGPTFKPHVHSDAEVPQVSSSDKAADSFGRYRFDEHEWNKGFESGDPSVTPTNWSNLKPRSASLDEGWDEHYVQEQPLTTNPLLGHLLDGTFSQAFTAEGFDHNEPREDVLRRHNMLPAEHLRMEAAVHDLIDEKAPEPPAGLDTDARIEHYRAHQKGFADSVRAEDPHGTEGMDDREVHQHWENHVRRAIGRGDISLPEAERRGFRGDDREHGRVQGDWAPPKGSEEPRRGGYKPLPSPIHHVTTNLKAVLDSGGLKTRREQGMGPGTGLGGGSDDHISVTSDHNLAHDIYHSLHEYHAFLNGKITREDMLSKHLGNADEHEVRTTLGHSELPGQAEQEAREMTSSPRHYGSNRDPKDDSPAPFMTMAEVHAKHGTDWQVKEGHEPVSGEGDTAKYASHAWERPMSDEEKIHARSETYKRIAWIRGSKGGHRDPLFMSNDPVAFARSDPKNFCILHMRPSNPKASGYPLRGDGEHESGADSGEWRVPTGEALKIHGTSQPEPRHLQEQYVHDERMQTRTAAQVYGRVHYPAEGPDGEPSDGIMIALVPPKQVINRLPLPEDGEHPSNVHITLVYMGKVSEFTKEQVADLPEVIEAWAETQKPLKATVQGVGTFANPGSHVLWAAADIPGGNHMWVSLADTLKEHGYSFKENHGWTPHLTMSYEKHHVRFLPKVERMEFAVREVWCCIGGRWESFRFKG